MAKGEQITFKAFRTRFATEKSCRDYLFAQRFPDGFVCPKCGCRAYYALKTRQTCQCKQCRRQTSVTAGTVMHRTHLPLTVWFWAFYLCATDKRGISAKGLAGQLGISYESAWFLLARIRRAMRERDQRYLLKGLVEMDEAYLGAPKRGKKRGRGTERGKMAVAVSKDEKGHPQFLHLQIIPNMRIDFRQLSCHCELVRTPAWQSVPPQEHKRERIATPACGLVRNDNHGRLAC